MRAKDLQGFGPVGTNGPTNTPAEVAEALDALVHFASSARVTTYAQSHAAVIRAHIADLERQLAEAREKLQWWKDRSDEVHNEWQKDRDRAEAAEAQLAAQRERDGRDAVRRLVGLWRAVDDGDAFDGPDYERGRIETLLNCADELDAALMASMTGCNHEWVDAGSKYQSCDMCTKCSALRPTDRP
jgi:hypothetical protein